MCRRCGWRARRAWTDGDLTGLKNYGAGVEPDPDLVVLDADHDLPGTRSGRKGSEPKPLKLDTTAEQFDLAALNLAKAGTNQAADPLHSGSGRVRTSERRGVRSRRKKSRRREIVFTIAVTATAMFLAILLGLTGSCAGSTDVL